jgi:hypothetical protein
VQQHNLLLPNHIFFKKCWLYATFLLSLHRKHLKMNSYGRITQKE